MGYNTVALILNDALGVIGKDPDFGRSVQRAVQGWYDRDRKPYAVEASARTPDGGCHIGALKIISQDHADGEQVVIVHGNTGQRCSDANDLGWHALQQMKEALERHGYRVTKRRKPPSPAGGRR